ncbi:CbrC family protein [Acinetobacter sp. 2JN-4]|uniref:CbrC family protein n=1 Tax=Acinetobacter sp. 2JN-4 TaxID=2479844 RepID=UPI000EF9ED3C|nr:CbrC family protein [Acinetobacter sp. 2JN-4]RLZ08521.1 CbrC family protein [Acinetobacter sp. 2JN-4]
MKLPIFKYHPDPIATESIIESDEACLCCGQVKGYIYSGPVYAEEELAEAICPWCIADGSAHKKFDAAFTDEAGIGAYGKWGSVPDLVVEEVAYRTPGFSGWQQERWWTHCGDAAAFVGRAGRKELFAMGEEAVLAIQNSIGLVGEDWNRFLQALDKDGSPTAYLFKCLKCGELGGYQDCN